MFVFSYLRHPTYKTKWRICGHFQFESNVVILYSVNTQFQVLLERYVTIERARPLAQLEICPSIAIA